MHYQLLNILRRFLQNSFDRWLLALVICFPLLFVFSRFLGLSRNDSLALIFGALVLVLLMSSLTTLRNRMKNRRRSLDFEADLRRHSQNTPASKAEIDEAVADLSQQWSNAMKELKEHRVSIYELPWFLLIGEPQSGKTTTLEKSGLEFPIGQEAISGVGGTRNCDWWFTEDAIILDTAGRFTFQDEGAPDKHEWKAFLGLLKKHRRECPINGVLVVIPATSLTEDPLEEQHEKALNIRRKLEHLQRSLDIRFPIFVLITKADRILGFSEFFGSLHPDLHGQIFGWSNPEEDKRWDPKGLSEILNGIARRMQKLRLRLMHEARDSQQMDRFFVFPEEFAALEWSLLTYLEVIFKASSRFQEPFLFRGFYLTSGLQQGRPIAVACRDLLYTQGANAGQILEHLETVLTHKFAFFIRDFYSKKVFPEQGLVRRTINAVQKEKKNQRLVPLFSIMAITMMFFSILPSFLRLSQALRPLHDVVEEARSCLEIVDTDAPCGDLETYELVYEIERAKMKLRESRWAIRLLLQDETGNEIDRELLSSVQAALLRRSGPGGPLEEIDFENPPGLTMTEQR